jgi:cysteine desulfurase/selenocysteine lyase
MDASPIDIETLTRLANDLFKADSAPGTGPGQSAPVPHAADHGLTPSLSIPTGGRPVSPLAPEPMLGTATRPAVGVPAGVEPPVSNFASTLPVSGVPPVPTSPSGFEIPFPSAFHLKDIPDFGQSFPEEAELRALLAPRDSAILGGGAMGAVPVPPHGLGTLSPFEGGLPYTTASMPDVSGGTNNPSGFIPAASVPAQVSGTSAARQAPGLPGFGGLTPSTTPSFYFIDEGYFADDVPKVQKSAGTIFNPGAARSDFPIFKQRINGYPLIWLDNGATTQKPQVVIDRISAFYTNENSNIHRAAHELAARATDAYEDARKTVQRFINAGSVEELIFVRGTTEGINLVAQSFGRRFIGKGDEIVVTHFEHHANIVPWYLLAKEVGAVLKVAPVDDHGNIILDEYERLLNGRTKIVAMTHVSNALGTVLPAKAMTEIAHRHGIPVLLDGAQSISHMPIDVQDLGCDFFVFSGHKVFAPTGIGVVYGKKALLDSMPPWQGGGNMIKDVTFEKIEFQPAPFRFEAGTGNIADAVGLGEALKYLERIGMTNIMRYEHDILEYALHRLREIKSLRIIGNPQDRAGVISLLIDGLAPDEVGKALNQKGIAVRAGHHCAMPILRRFGVEATVRPSFALYNTFEDVDRLAETLHDIAINRAN